MESERRHEMEKNDLDMLLRVKAPEFFQKHGANILLGILLVAALAYFLYQKRQARVQEVHSRSLNTAVAYNFALQLRDMAERPDLSDSAALQRQRLASDVFSAADQVLNSDSEPAQKASAQLAKAEALWALATTPPAGLATTQPVAGFVARTQADYLQDAYSAYYDGILKVYADQKEVAANALLSLAAIEESRQKFAEAKQWYEKVLGDNTLRPIYHEIAKSRVARLDDLSKPFTLAKPTSQPTTAPVSAPTTQPMGVPWAPPAQP